MGPFIYYVITSLGLLDPPPPLRNHVFSTENNQKLAFSDPPSPPTSDYVIYEWSLIKIKMNQKIMMNRVDPLSFKKVDRLLHEPL